MIAWISIKHNDRQNLKRIFVQNVKRELKRKRGHNTGTSFPTRCKILFEGKEMTAKNPKEAEDLGVASLSAEQARAVANAVAHSPLILREPLDVTEDMLCASLLAADRIGKTYRDSWRKTQD